MGKFQVIPELKGEVTYGDNIKAIAAFLYSEGVVANDRIWIPLVISPYWRDIQVF